MEKNKYITYAGYKHDKYIGKRLYSITECGGDKQYRVKENMLLRNSEGILGSIGEGIHWGMNYLTQSGAYCFNPIKEKDLLWSYAHNTYFYKEDKTHFEYPIIQGQFYNLKNGKKFIGHNELIPKLNTNYRGFCKISEYF